MTLLAKSKQSPAGQEERLKSGGGGTVNCVLKWGFMQTFPRNQDVTVKLKSELVFIKF